MNTLTVAEISIRQDAEGRYCLKDIHQAAVAAGFNRRTKEPGKFFATKNTQELVAELRRETTHNLGSLKGESATQNLGSTLGGIAPTSRPINTVESGPYKDRGTFVVKELVYAYAMWVSPAFHLRVIRVYDYTVTAEITQHENYWFARRPHWPPIRMRVLAGECYRSVAEALQISSGRVARAVRRMIQVGILAPLSVAQMQKGPARKAALKYGEGWGQRQLGLFDALPA